MVEEGAFSEDLQKAAEIYIGCVAGAMRKDAYLQSLGEIGFTDIKVLKERALDVPENLLAAYLSADQRKALAQLGIRVLSITMQGTKAKQEAAVGPRVWQKNPSIGVSQH